MMTWHSPERTIAYWANRAEKAEKERDEARSLECSDLDAHWRLDEAMETIQRLAQERDEARATKNMHKERAQQALADLDRAEARDASWAAFLARVRRDAARDALVEFRRTELALIPSDADEDDPIRTRQQALAWRIEMHLLGNYPEEVSP